MSIPHRMSATRVEKKTTEVEPADASLELEARPVTDADALAVRAIARYNVERRKAGEPPLDLKGIALFRKILADAIERYEVSNGAEGDVAH